MATHRTVQDVDKALLDLWQRRRDAIDFWRIVDCLLDVRLTLDARRPSHL